jgi:hypothetical protein
MKMNNFAVFILSHGRAEKCINYKKLREQGYTGKIYIMVDNLDSQISLYKKIYGDSVIVFDKQKAINMTDSGDNQKKHNSVVYARNYNFIVAKELGIDYFLQLDDDYSTFGFSMANSKEYIGNKKIKSLDNVFVSFIKYLQNTNIKGIAFAQGGDFIGGAGAGILKKFWKGEIPRKIMNSFFFATDKPVKFMGRINEDVNLYVTGGIKGDIFVTHPMIRLEQMATQQNSGGLTDIYLDMGTYVKSFYSVMYAPSCVKVSIMGVTNKRIHHKIKWNNCIPKIISEKHLKTTLSDI